MGMVTPTTEMERMQLQYGLECEKRIAELEARCAALAHSYDVTFKRRVALEAMCVRLCEDLDAEFGPGRVDVNWPELRDLART